MKRIVSVVLFLSGVGIAAAAPVLLHEGAVPPGFERHASVFVPTWRALDAACAKLGVRPGAFPALVDPETGAWVAVRPGDSVEDSEARLVSESARLEDHESSVFRDSKPLSRKLLENEWFDLADEIALAAGDSPVAEADARDLSKLRAKLKKAKASKDAAAGPGKKAKADDLLEINELRGRLLLIDAELRTYDPQWAARAERHVLP